MKWSEKEIEYLVENFSNKYNCEISKYLGRTELSITNKANKLGLKKSKTHISKHISHRNKIMGRDLNFELLSQIAKKFKTKSEFQKSDPSAYSTARRLGILNKICCHMIIKNFSIPQIILNEIIEKVITKNVIFNDRKTLKPYEIDIFLPEYNLGFEYNGKGWHINNTNDDKKQILAEKMKINLIIIKENSRSYEVDIKNQLVDNLNIINKICNKKISKNDILDCDVTNPYQKIYDLEDLKLKTKKYKSFKEFYQKESGIYQKISKLGLIDDLTSHMCCRRKKRNINEIIDKISKHIYLIDLIKKDYGTYLFIKKNKLEYLLDGLKRK
jgi:hypothetical protein